MVATRLETLLGEVLVSPDDLTVQEWCEAVRRVLREAPLTYLRGFKKIEDLMKRSEEIHFDLKAVSIKWCKGANERSVFFYCARLDTKCGERVSLPHTIGTEVKSVTNYLVMNRDQEFFVVTAHSTYRYTGYGTSRTFRSLSFTPAKLEEVMEKHKTARNEEKPGVQILESFKQGCKRTLEDLQQQVRDTQQVVFKMDRLVRCLQ